MVPRWWWCTRLCDVKVAKPRSEPFEETLNAWLTLFFVPAVRGACARLQLARGRGGECGHTVVRV